MDVLMECCCGLDVHKDMVEACIIQGWLEEPAIYREQFGTMESTGIYWRRVYETIEEAPRWDCLLVVNARHMRNLPGQKSDVKDAEWIATLLRHGLLEHSYIPEKTIRDLREFSRLRRVLVQEKNRHINRLEKFLQAHGFRLSSVLSDMLCVSGRKLLKTRGRFFCLATSAIFQLSPSSSRSIWPTAG